MCADVRDALPTIKGVDCAVTDPPYRLTSGGCRPLQKGGKAMSGIFNQALYDNAGEIVPCDIEWADWPHLLYDALADDADVYVMANDKNLIPAGVAVLGGGFKIHNICVWDKVGGTPNSWYMKNCEFAVYAWKGRARPINDMGCKQLVSLPNSKESQHPTEKPVPLMAHYIANSTARGESVIDPFMGSGTTGVAAINLGRKFYGIEKNPRFFDMACERISRAGRQPDFFVDAVAETTTNAPLLAAMGAE